MSFPPFRSESRVPGRLVGLAAALAVVVGAEVAVRLVTPASAPEVVFTGEFYVGVLTVAPFVAGTAYAGYWLADSDIEERLHRRVWWWTVAGAGASTLLNFALMAVMPVDSWLLAVSWLRWGVGVGAGIGVGVGVTEARAIQKALEAERSAVRAEHLEVQRDLLDYLNSLLRHEVLNASNVISGYAALLADEHDEGTPGREYSETIRRKSDDITTVIEDVRVLLQAADGRSSLEPVDVADVVRTEAAKLTDLDEDVVVDVDAPETVEVPADALLARVFGNLLANAVVHNDSDTPRVSVTVDADDESVVVDVADNGPGIPDADAESLFERPSQRTADHGLGLYLVRKLVHHYGGRVELRETGPSGSVFRVELPREPGAIVGGPARDTVESPVPFAAVDEQGPTAAE
ncbi:MAG: sensor histidine kinase [Halobacterium sp.]